MPPQDEIVVATTASPHLPAGAIETVTQLIQRTELALISDTPPGEK